MKISLPNLALFNRSILLDNRHWQSYIYRFVVLGVILFTLFNFCMTSLSRLLNATGLYFLTAIAHINIVFITLLGISMFSSAITEEKEVDSLGLLMMTGISPISMLISKGTGKLIMGLMLVISQFPFVLLSITLGGVSLFQVCSVFVSLLVYMILVNNLALFFSVFCRRTVTSAGMSFCVLVAFNILTPIWVLTRWLSPFYRMGKIMETFSTEPIWGLQNTVYICCSLFFFVLSFLLFEKCCRNSQPASAPRLPGKSRKSKWNIFRVKRSWQNAIAWKTFYFNVGGKFSMFLIHLIVLIIIGVVLIFVYKSGCFGSLDSDEFGGILLVVGLVALFVEGIYISDTIFHSEVWQQTLSTLLTIPQSLKSIAYKKIVGGFLITIPTLLIILAGMILLFDELSREIDDLESWGVLVIWILAVNFYYHLVTYFSLILRHGGFIIAFFVYAVLFAVIAIPIGIFDELFNYHVSDDILMVGTIILYIPAIVFMHFMIGLKIKSIAAKG